MLEAGVPGPDGKENTHDKLWAQAPLSSEWVPTSSHSGRVSGPGVAIS